MRALHRLLPRFSLGTLAVFLLLVTSGMGLWWRWAPWYCERVTEGRLGEVTGAAFCPATSALVITVRNWPDPFLWDIHSGEFLGSVCDESDAHEAKVIQSVEFSRDGKHLLILRFIATACVHATDSGSQLAVLEGKDLVGSAHFSPDGTRVVTRDAGGFAVIWDWRERQALRTLKPLGDYLDDTQMSDDGAVLLTTTSLGLPHLWDAETGDKLLGLLIEGDAEKTYSCAALSPTGELAVAARDGNVLHVWDVRKRKHMGLLRGHTGVPIHATFSADGSMILTGSIDKTARVWDARSLKCISVMADHQSPVADARFSPDGSRVITRSAGGLRRVWSTREGRCLAVLSGLQTSQRLLEFADQGERIVTMVYRSVQVWKRRRPEWWWGVFYLWEFWLTAAFAGLFAWSILRDRRSLARPPESA